MVEDVGDRLGRKCGRSAWSKMWEKRLVENVGEEEVYSYNVIFIV